MTTKNKYAAAIPPKKLSFKDHLFHRRESKLIEQREINRFNAEISNLEYTKRIAMNELISDKRFFKSESFIQWIKEKFDHRKFVYCEIHSPDNIDVIKKFPLINGHIADINEKYYNFSPKDFRYVNGEAKLEFYYNHPFAILHNIKDSYVPPTIDADAFRSVMKSKHVKDATSVENPNDINGYVLISIIASALTFILCIIILVVILKKPKPEAVKLFLPVSGFYLRRIFKNVKL